MENWTEATNIAIEIFHHSPFQGRFSPEEKEAYILELSELQWRMLSKAKRRKATQEFKLKTYH